MADSMTGWKIRDTKEQIGSGSILMDDWEIKKLIGKGGFGEVWLAEKSTVGITEQSAIKVIRIPRDPDDIDAMRAEGFSEESIQAELRRNVENAVREIRTLLELQGHPSIVPYKSFDVIQFEDDGTWEIDIRMQLLTSLTDWLAANRITSENVIRLGLTLTELLSVCEKENILHRDIKPANIFVDKLNNFKLGDFGLARVVSESSATHSKGVGTEAFMAPEVFRSGKYDHRADLYSLGLVMYWMLNNQSLPFTSKNTSRSEAIARRLSGEPLPALSGTDPELDRIVRKACEADPGKRWRTAKEFHDALQNLSVSSPQRPKKGGWKAAVAVLAVIALLAGGYVLLKNFGSSGPDSHPTDTFTPYITDTPTSSPTDVPQPSPSPTLTPEPSPIVEEKATQGVDRETNKVMEHKEDEAQIPVLLATVNGEEIWSDNENLKVAMDYYFDQAESYGRDTSSEEVISLLQQYSMEYAQETALIYQKAAELGLSATEEDKVQAEATAKAKWIEELDNFALNAGLVTEDASDDDKAAARADAAAQIQEYYGYDEAKYVAEAAESEIYTLISDRLKEKVVGDKKVTDEEIKAYYEDLVKDDREAYENDIGTYEFYTQYYGQPSYFTPEGYRGIVHILLPVDEELMNTWNDLSARLEQQASQAEKEATEGAPAPDAESTAEPEANAEPVTQEMVDAAKQAILDSVKGKVAEINSKLEAGTSFDDLIKEYGTDPGMQDDARRASGYAVHADSILYDTAFRDAAIALEKIGDISEPVVGQHGVYILQYRCDIPGGAVELTEEMIEEFRGTLQSEMESEMMATAVEEWINASEIVYTEAGEPWRLIKEEKEEAE